MPRERQPSAPGLPGHRLPPPDSLPPEDRILRELASVEGKLLAKIGEAHELSTATAKELRDLQGWLRVELSTVHTTLQQRAQTDIEHTEAIGSLRTDMVKAGGAAGGRKGLAAAVATVAIGGFLQWAGRKLGIDL